MGLLLVIWLVVAAGIMWLASRNRAPAGPLCLSYFFSLSVLHVPGVLPYLNDQFGGRFYQQTEAGFELTLLGMTALLLGMWVGRAGQWDTAISSMPDFPAGTNLKSAAVKCIWAGVLSYFVLVPVTAQIPSATALISATSTILIVGLWFRMYLAHIESDARAGLFTLALLPLLPLATLVTGGFLGYGMNWVLSVLCFVFVMSRRKLWLCLLAPCAVLLALSLFVTYMGQRNDIRDVVWIKQASYAERLEQVEGLVTQFQFLDLSNPRHALALEGRLNQNLLVGAGITRAEAGLSNFQYGATVPVWMIVPRAIWPGKPAVGGSGDLVSKFTGIDFARGTSVGVGQVLEFYMNFGTAGVLLGFAALGFALIRMDTALMRRLGAGDLNGAAAWAMPGLTLIQPGGSLIELIVGFVAALVCGRIVERFELLTPRKKPMRVRAHLPVN